MREFEDWGILADKSSIDIIILTKWGYDKKLDAMLKKERKNQKLINS